MQPKSWGRWRYEKGKRECEGKSSAANEKINITDRKLFFIKEEENRGRSVSQELEMCDD
jgi:hypothetical protein